MTVANLRSTYGDVANRSAINLDRCSFSPALDVKLAVDCGAARNADDAQPCSGNRDFDIGIWCLVDDFLCPRVDFTCFRISALVEVRGSDVAAREHKADAVCATSKNSLDCSTMRAPGPGVVIGRVSGWIFCAIRRLGPAFTVFPAHPFPHNPLVAEAKRVECRRRIGKIARISFRVRLHFKSPRAESAQSAESRPQR